MYACNCVGVYASVYVFVCMGVSVCVQVCRCVCGMKIEVPVSLVDGATVVKLGVCVVPLPRNTQRL